MAEFQLFRLKIVHSGQVDLFTGVPDNAILLRRILVSRPIGRFRGLAEWHVGNIRDLDDDGIYFAVGRISQATVPVLNETGDFVEAALEEAPYTHVIADVHLGVAAIARNSRLSPTTYGIARNLQRLLGNSSEARALRVTLDVAPISDPEEFIEHLRTAYAVTRFTMTFSRPNPFDVEGHFHRPMEELAQATDATGGRTSVSGPSLNTEVLEDLARSAAATGNDARASLRREPGTRLVTKSLHENSATFAIDEPQTEDDRMSILRVLRLVYERIRSRL